MAKRKWLVTDWIQVTPIPPFLVPIRNMPVTIRQMTHTGAP